MGKDKKLPAFQWYAGDWRKDLAVQSLSFHDRGVWREMLDLMHDSERRGVLVLNGRAMTDDQISRAIGLDNQSFNQTLGRLLTSGVASREEETGAIFNRRMVRDEEIRKIRTCAGLKGGNPNLLNQTPKQNPTPSLSPSGKKTKVRKCSIPLPDWIPENLWFEYEDVRKRKRAAMTDPIRFRIIKRLTEFKESGLDPLISLENSIRNCYTDVFEPKTGAKNGTQNNRPSLADIAAESGKNSSPSDGDAQGSKDGRGFLEFVQQSTGPRTV